MEKWTMLTKKADFMGIGQKFGIDPVIARIIRNRDIIEEEEIRLYLYGALKDLHSPWLLKDMGKAVEILQKKIQERAKIRIIGDYDIDGVSSTYILLKGLGSLGADVDNYIPDRIEDGYGINMNEIQKAAMDGVDTIVTCDNGIAAPKEIQSAKEMGMTVIVTDHHDIPYKETENGRESVLPPADAVINPKRWDCAYPNKKLCGAAVALKLISALFEKAQIPETELDEYIEIAAFATVGDVMDLQGENRILVKEGLKRMQHTKNLGLQALIYATGLSEKEITAGHVGFLLGPCINASGRLDSASRALGLLRAKNLDEAAYLARDLVAINIQRKAMQREWEEKAIAMAAGTEIKKDRVLVIYLPKCHESLAGLIAGKVRETYNKPVFVLTKGKTSLKGSGRSIEEYSMFEEMMKCKDLMLHFGGHPKAAGLSLKEENLEAFRKAINENCTLTEEDLYVKETFDVAMPFYYIKKPLVEQMKILEPCGNGNPKPVFGLKDLQVLDCRIYGKNRNVAKVLLMEQSGTKMDGVYFGDADAFAEYVKEKGVIAILYEPEINTYMGQEKIQIRIKKYR